MLIEVVDEHLRSPINIVVNIAWGPPNRDGRRTRLAVGAIEQTRRVIETQLARAPGSDNGHEMAPFVDPEA